MLKFSVSQRRPVRRSLAVLLAALLALVLASCGTGMLTGSNALYLPDLIAKAQDYSGKEVTVEGAYVSRGGISVLAPVVSTLDNGLDAQPHGDLVWLDAFPEEVKKELHQPGDAVYGFVQVSGRFESGGSYGPEQQYKYRIEVTSARPIETVRRNEVRVPDEPPGEGKVPLRELLANPDAYNGQTVTTRAYYFWNGPLAVLAEGISTEEDGSSPQPVGGQIWIEGFPPDVSSSLNLGPSNSFVWGYVEVTGKLTSGGTFGKDGAYPVLLEASGAQALEQKK